VKEIPIHFLPILIAALVRFGIGALWFSPVLFGKAWATLTGCSQDEMKQGMAKAMVADLVGNLILCFVLVHAIVYAEAHTFGQGAAVGFFNWLGFIAMPMLATVFWEHRPWRLYAIQTGFQLVSLIVIGGGLAAWYL
jgi:hypothetical protein